eukprot:4688893-Amphidinium_carterae.1
MKRRRVRHIKGDRSAHDTVRLYGMRRPELTVMVPQRHGRGVIDTESAKRRSSCKVLEELQSKATN